MSSWPFTKGLHDLGNGCYAYLQPAGTWGLSNAALVVDGDEVLLIDTLMDLRLTAEMLATMRSAVPAAANIDTLVNTHGNPDHFFGNQLVEGATIIASAAAAKEIAAMNPVALAGISNNWQQLGDAGAFFHDTMGVDFDYTGIIVTPPTQTFEHELTLLVGGKTVELRNVGPAHTGGDTLVHVPADRTIFTGDILFNRGHPIIWAGPIANWIAACDYILTLDVETVVPGHGPITDKSAVRDFKEHLEYIAHETRKRYDAGMDAERAARDISLKQFDGWSDEERIVANVMALYREFSGGEVRAGLPDLFGAMGRYRKEHADA